MSDIIQRLPLDGAVIGTFEYCPYVLFEPQLCSQCFPCNLQQLPNVLQKYSLKQDN